MSQNFKTKYFTPINGVALIIAILATYILFPPYLDMAIYPVPNSETYFWATLDPSWISGLNYVKIHNLNWGNEFAFTLGPLSYLTTRVGWGEDRLSFLLFDLFCALNFFLIFLITFLKSKNKILTGSLIIVLALLLPTPFWATYAFILMTFLLFWIRYSIDHKTPLPYIFQTVLVILLFFIKFNTGLISFVLFTAAILYKIVFKKDKALYLAGYFVLPIIGIYIASGFLNVTIPVYIKSAIEIVSGYNEIMYFYRPFGDNHLFALIIILSLIGILVYKTFKEDKKEVFKNILVLFLFSVAIYVLFKQAFVRADESHMKEFYYCALFISFCLYDFHLEQKNKYCIFLISLSAGISIYFVNKLDQYSIDFSAKTSKKGYFEALKSFTPDSGLKLFPNDNQLPQNILNRIGNKTIDSYPWNAQILLENKLNFTPRPVFQSYTAYTPALEDKNAAFYNSAKAPEFVLYDFGSIDNRYSLFDETKLNLIFTKNYSCVDTLTVHNRKTLLLERKANNNGVKLVQTKEYAMYIDSPIVPQEGVYYKVYLYRNLLGDFMSIIDHGPDIALLIVNKNGQVTKYKTSNKLLETGLFSTHHISGVDDFKSLMLGEDKESNRILGYYFEPANKHYFKDKIRIKEYKITQ